MPAISHQYGEVIEVGLRLLYEAVNNRSLEIGAQSLNALDLRRFVAAPKLCF